MLSSLLEQVQKSGIPVNANLVQKDLVIEFTEQEILNMLTAGMDSSVKENIKIELRDGKLIMKVKLLK